MSRALTYERVAMTLKARLESDLAEARRRLQRATFNNDRLMIEAFTLYVEKMLKQIQDLS